MKLFKVTPEASEKTKFVFATDLGQAMNTVPIILRSEGVEIEELCEALDIIPAYNNPQVLFLNPPQNDVIPIHRTELFHHFTKEMNRLEEVKQAIQKQKQSSLVRIFLGTGLIGLAAIIEVRGLPNSIYVKAFDLDRLSYLNLMAPVSCRMLELFDKDNNVLMYWEGTEDYQERIIHLTL